jgi:Ca2+-binding EF-hand superfamily protein
MKKKMSIVERAGVHKNDFAITKHHFLLKKTMEMLRQRLLDCAIKQSDLMEIFSAISRGLILFKQDLLQFFIGLDCSGRITFQEFSAAIKSLDIGIDDNEEIKDLFQQFDTTKNGQIDLYEFLQQLRPPMNERRRKAALDIFNSMDVDKDGKLTIADLKVFINLSITKISFFFQTKYATQLLPARRRSSENIDLVSNEIFLY